MPKSDDQDELAQLRDTLEAYHDAETTKHLYEYSHYLLEEIVERVSRLDAKAGQFASFAGGII